MKKYLGLLILVAPLAFAPVELTVFAQEIGDPVKAEIFRRFRDNRGPNQDVAYQAAKEYLEKYGKDKDKYTDYVEKWAFFYEREEREQCVLLLVNQENFSEAFRVGSKLLADNPNDLATQIVLVYAGYRAALNRDETHNAEALTFARKAIASLEPSRSLRGWTPFKNKDDTLAHLHYSIGFLTMKTNPDESIDEFIKAVQYDSDIRNSASTYYFLAAAYEAGPYKKLKDAYSWIGRKPKSEESKAAFQRLNVLVDHIIDAYARAVALAQRDSDAEKSRAVWLGALTEYYKFRHQGSDTGLSEFINSVLQTSLPAKP